MKIRLKHIAIVAVIIFVIASCSIAGMGLWPSQEAIDNSITSPVLSIS